VARGVQRQGVLIEKLVLAGRVGERHRPGVERLRAERRVHGNPDLEFLPDGLGEDEKLLDGVRAKPVLLAAAGVVVEDALAVAARRDR